MSEIVIISMGFNLIIAIAAIIQMYVSGKKTRETIERITRDE